MNIEIVHSGTKERRVFEVVFYNEKMISIHWPLAGTYDLDLKTNTMKARSPQARRKHPFCLWTAADIVLVRRQVWELLNPDHKEREDAYQRHQDWIVAQGMTVKQCQSRTPKPLKRRSRL